MLYLLKKQFSHCTLYGNGNERFFSLLLLLKMAHLKNYVMLLIGPVQEDKTL